MHNQNGHAEGQIQRATPLCATYLGTSPYLGVEYWDYAFVHANENLQHFVQRGETLSPMEKWQDEFPKERVHTDTAYMRAWGSKCYTYNETRSGFDPRKNVGYLLGYAPKHARGLYTVLNADTKRVKEAVAANFTKPSSDDQRPHAAVTVTFDKATAIAAPSMKATRSTRQVNYETLKPDTLLSNEFFGDSTRIIPPVESHDTT